MIPDKNHKHPPTEPIFHDGKSKTETNTRLYVFIKGKIQHFPLNIRRMLPDVNLRDILFQSYNLLDVKEVTVGEMFSSEVMLCGDIIIVISQSLLSLGGWGHRHGDGQFTSCSQSR